MHDIIRRFYIDGTFSPKVSIIAARREFERTLFQKMRDEGVVPRLDILSDWSTGYNSSKDIYTFELSCYGVFVGREEAWQILGIDHTRKIPIQNSKSAPPSEVSD